MQLDLFTGGHIPLTAARQAIARGDLLGAAGQLSRSPRTEEAEDGRRLEGVARALHDPIVAADPAAVHARFEAALAPAHDTKREGLGAREWQSLYAAALARALGSTSRTFRGWLGLHFAWVGGDARAAVDPASALVSTMPPGPAWLEAARIAFVSKQRDAGREWLAQACLASDAELAPTPPELAPCGVAVLDRLPALPELPARVLELFVAVRGLDLAPPLTRWVAVLGEMEGELGPRLGSEGGPLDDPDERGDTEHVDGPTEFVAALRAARRSRARDRSRGSDQCSDRELRARRRMQRIAPTLLPRYLATLGLLP
jgi:hypothetical protein